MENIEKPTITEKQKEARRANGRKSRGPTSVEGKDRSSQNRVTHGCYSNSLRAIHSGPLREDPAEMKSFVEAFVAELDPGESAILMQAALDVADKAWRVRRAQIWEAEGHSGADYVSHDAAQTISLRLGARNDFADANTVRLFTDHNVANDDLKSALFALGFGIGLSDEELEWVDDADKALVVDALRGLIDECFSGQASAAASFLEERATNKEAEASATEDWWRPTIIRNEMDGSFARNAERLVSHASREYDRSLRRYRNLIDQIGQVDKGEPDDPDDEEPDDPHPAQPRNGIDPSPGEGVDRDPDSLGIWEYITADEAVELFRSVVGKWPTRNEPTERNGEM